MLWLQASGETGGFFKGQGPSEGCFFYICAAVGAARRKCLRPNEKKKSVSLPELCLSQTLAQQRAKFCRFQKRRRWAENPSAVNQSFCLFVVFVTVINDKNNKEAERML